MSFEGKQHSPETRARMSAAQRARTRQHTAGMGLAELRAKTPPGECPFCGEPIQQEHITKKHQTCGDEICRSAYHRFYKRDQRRKAP